MSGWPWKKKADPQRDDRSAQGDVAVAVTAAGDRSVAANAINGDVYTGDVRQVHLAPGAVQPPDDIEVPAAGVHNLPRRPNPVFVGREHLLAHVAGLFAPATDGLAPGARAAVGQAITGLGGIGKSEVALQYAHGRAGPGAVVWWADAETAETIDIALADLAYQLQPNATEKEWKTGQAAAWAVRWLQAHTGWLLVLDNVESPDQVTALLGRLISGDILITTRRAIAWTDQGVTPVTLDVLPRPASIELLRERLAAPGPAQRHDDDAADRPGFDADAADALAAELGDLPLALQQAAGYVTANRLPLAAYLQRLRQQTGTMLAKAAPGTIPHRAVARVFAVTVDALTEAAPDAVYILWVLAWLAPVPLPRQILTPLQDAGITSDLDDQLGLLASYSLITLTTRTVATHRLVQACLREHDRVASDDSGATAMELTGGQAMALTLLLHAVPADPVANLTGWGMWRDLLPHLDALFDHLPWGLPNLNFAGLLGLSGVYLWGQGRPRDALPLEQRALAITEAALGPDHVTTALRLSNLAATLGELGRYNDALPLQQRALTITEAALGPDHPDTALRLEQLAGTHTVLDRCTDALPLRQRALAITEAALGPDHPDTATRLDDLAATLADLGQLTDALPLQQRALAITEAALGSDHADTALRLDNLAYTLAMLGRHTDAFRTRQRALTITEATLGPDHPDTATRLDFLADLSQPNDALPLRQRALAITEAILGPDHPATATRLDNVADLSPPADALPLRQRALAITEATLGPDHPATAIRLDRLAATLTALGQPTVALALQQRAFAITEATLGPDHPTRARVLNNLAATLDAVGQHQEATDLRERHPAAASPLDDRGIQASGPSPVLARPAPHDALRTDDQP